MKSLEAHFICRGERGVFRRTGSFVTGEWKIPLAKAQRIARVCLHQNQSSPAYLVGKVNRVWMSPADGRITFAATIESGVETGVIDAWAQWVAYRPLNAEALTPDREALIRAVVRLGFIVAGADGLDDAESDALTEYAVDRSGLPEAAVIEERARATGGPEVLTDADVALLRALDPIVRDSLLDEIVEVAAADGTLTEAERTTMRAVRLRI